MWILPEPIQFEWDHGNYQKNWQLHQVSNQECEEVFFDPHKRLLKDTLHSQNEERYLLLGETRKQRLLFVVFTIRGERVRIVSARDVNKKERPLYEEA